MQTTTSASAQSATSSTASNPILTASEQASENAAMTKMFAEVRKAEAKANAPQVTTITSFPGNGRFILPAAFGREGVTA